MNIDVERVAFEAEFSKGSYRWTFERRPAEWSVPGAYKVWWVEHAWQAWLAGAAREQEPQWKSA